MRQLLTLTVLLCLCPLPSPAADAKGEDTPKAAATRKLLKQKITVEFKETRLEDALDEIKEQVKGFKFLLDAKGGVSRNQTLNYNGKNKSVEEVLDEMLKKSALGYVVISKKGDAYDGLLQIRKSAERGYPLK